MAESIWSENGGIFCGFPANATEGKPPPYRNEIRYRDDRHIVLIGPNGSGKTKRFIVPALTELTGWTCLVNDIKGELCAMTMAHRQAAGNQIIRLNPFNVLGLGSDGFNPVAALDDESDDFPDDALELAEAMIRIEGREPHWAQAAQELVAALIMYVRLILPKDGSLVDVREFLSRDDDGWKKLVTGGRDTDPRQLELFEKSPDDFPDKKYRPPVKHHGKLYPGMVVAAEMFDWPQIENKCARFASLSAQDREMHSVISTALVQTRWLDSVPVQADIGKNPFDFTIAKEKPVTVYLILPARRLGTHAPWLRLMIASFLQKQMKDTRPGKVPIMLLLDEYATLAGGSGYGKEDTGDGFPVVARNMPLFRGYGIKLFTAWQDLAQAKRIYGEEGFESFLANAGIVQTFAPQDVVTAEYISKRTGQTTRKLWSRGQSRSPNPAWPMGISVTDNVNISLIPTPLMLPQEIRNMDTGFSIIVTHKAKGVVRSYLPWPSELPHLRDIMALDPSRGRSQTVPPAASVSSPPKPSFFGWLRRVLHV